MKKQWFDHSIETGSRPRAGIANRFLQQFLFVGVRFLEPLSAECQLPREVPGDV